MYDLINIYTKDAKGRWEYQEGTRMFTTLGAAASYFAGFYGVPVDSTKASYALPTFKIA